MKWAILAFGLGVASTVGVTALPNVAPEYSHWLMPCGIRISNVSGGTISGLLIRDKLGICVDGPIDGLTLHEIALTARR